MKTTSISYCQVCSKDFKNGEIVYYVPIDNNIVCSGCADKSNAEVHERLVEIG